LSEPKSRKRTSTNSGAAAVKPQGAAARPAAAGKTTGAARPAARAAPSGAGTASSVGGGGAPATTGTGATKSPSTAGAATIRFLSDWREEVSGAVCPGGRLRVEYAAERLPGDGGAPAKNQGVVAEVRFVPGGQHHTGRVTGGKFEVAVPADASEVMIWFYRTDRGGTSWDSRFGENYRFPISGGATDGQARARTTGRASGRRPAPAA
jgi:hypothetical protein